MALRENAALFRRERVCGVVGVVFDVELVRMLIPVFDQPLTAGYSFTARLVSSAISEA
jgi:hypothetical protein